jgi:hypothetical protein
MVGGGVHNTTTRGRMVETNTYAYIRVVHEFWEGSIYDLPSSFEFA